MSTKSLLIIGTMDKKEPGRAGQRSRFLLKSQLFLYLILGGCLLLGFSSVAVSAPPLQATKVLSDKMDSDLKFSQSRVALVLVVDENGAIQAHRGAKTKAPVLSKFPLHAADITNMTGITVFATSNPKTCWTTTSGDLYCVEW
ncbi:MAG: hypothetical protein GXP10_10315 [Gammaproteobacteria bacterium]|nr:hypothetical protein [Gammaproteobacteria bacterium]